jgi:hypothetical protein
MVIHMKTTVEISESLLEKARAVAQKEKTTLRRLIEEGLRKVLKERGRREGFKLRKASFKGNGLLPHADEESWERIRSLIYEERGG